jgi:hypothetical protein
MRGILALVLALATTAAQAQFVMTEAKSPPLSAAVREAGQTALAYFDLEASCRHVLPPGEIARVRLAGWDALVAGGYLPEGADAAVLELDRLSQSAEPWTPEQCSRGIRAFDANKAGDLDRIRALVE